MSEPFDAVIVGADFSGLVAGAYLAGSGARTVVLAAKTSDSCAHTLYALDPLVVKDLKLARRGLKFAARDLATVYPRGEGEPIVLSRDAHACARSIAPHSSRDAERFGDFRRELFAFARAMRALWWEEGELRESAQQDRLRTMSVTGASAFLDATFESEAVKAAFAFDAMEGGLSPADAGSSLLFAWRAAQEMCGLQGAVALPRGGMSALGDAASAAGVEIRTGVSVERILLAGDAVAGVAFASGEEIKARLVLSSLSRRRTLLELAPSGAVGFAASERIRRSRDVGEAKLELTLNAVPELTPPGRYVIAERMESCMAAHAMARAGRLPDDLVLEAVVPGAFDSGAASAVLSVLVRPLPVAPAEGWSQLAPLLAEKVLAILERHAPGLRAAVTDRKLVMPAPDGEPLDAARLTASWRARFLTPVDGLLLCGESAEPAPAISGRAARIAAAWAIARLKGEAR